MIDEIFYFLQGVPKKHSKDLTLIFGVFFLETPCTCCSKQEREAKIILADSQKKYEEMFRRLGVMEEELKRAEERADHCQKKLEDIDTELKVSFNSGVKSLLTHSRLLERT